MQKKPLNFLLKNQGSTYEDLLENSSCQNVNLRRQKTPFIKILETLNKLNPGYVNDIFNLRNTVTLTCKKYNLNLKILKPNQTTF